MMPTIFRGVRVALVVAALALAGRLTAGEPKGKAAKPIPSGSTSTSIPAENRSLPSDLRLIPLDTYRFLSLRPADIFDKVLTKDTRQAKEWNFYLEKDYGLKITDIERLTYAIVAAHKQLDIIRTLKPYNPVAIRDKLTPGAKKQEIAGKTCYRNADTGQLVCFLDDHVFLLCDKDEEDALAGYVKAATGNLTVENPLTKALEEVPQHLMVGFSSMDILQSLICDLGGLDEGVTSLLIGEGEWVVVKCDYDGEIKIDARLTFPTGKTAAKGKVLVQMGLDMMRWLCLKVMLGNAAAKGTYAQEERRWSLQLTPLARECEKSLQGLKIKSAKRAEGYELAVKLVFKAPKEAIISALGEVVPASRLAGEKHTPSWPEDAPDGPPAPQTATDPKAETSAPPPETVVPGPEPIPLPQVSPLPPPATATVETSAVILTVANLTKAKALLYQQGVNNKLTFSKEVGVGEAIDVPAEAGQRWFVVFPDKKDAGETFVLGSGDGTWLLR